MGAPQGGLALLLSPGRAGKGRGQRARSRASLPMRLAALMLTALALGTFSTSRLRAGGTATSSSATRADPELVRLGAAGSRQPQQQQDVQQQQGGTQQQPQDGTCFDRYPWINPALDVWYDKAWASANGSTQSTEEALQVLRNTLWKKYHPGMDEIILRLDEHTGKVAMDILQVAPPNQMHKKRCMLGLLQDAVEAHNDELAAVLRSVGGGRQMSFIVETEDFGITWRAQKNKLPAFAMCTDDNHSDIPVPDFTYYCYPEARYSNSSWPAIQSLLQHKSDMVAWHERHSELFHRSNWGVGPRRGLMPLLQTYDNGTAEMSATDAFGCELDIKNTGFVNVKEGQAMRKVDSFVWLDGQCDYKYVIHTAGFSYSAGLKYKMACGSMVFKFDSTYKEFFEPALQDQVHVVKLPAKVDGVDPAMFKSFTAPLIKQVVQRTINLDHTPPIPRQAQAFVREQLTMEALHCYWLGALQRYAQLYFLPDKTQREATAAQQQQQEQQQQQQADGSAESGGADVSAAGNGGGEAAETKLP